MSCSAPKYLESPYFRIKNGWEFLEESASDEDKHEFEEYWNDEYSLIQYREKYPQYYHPYRQWNGKVIEKPGSPVPAKVQYNGIIADNLTPGKIYDAFFIEYWQGIRNSLYVRDDSGAISSFHPFDEFYVISDEDNVLNLYEAIVKCTTDKYDGEILEISSGSLYRAIGKNKVGFYLIMDDSKDCYYYPSECFKVIDDPHGVLRRIMPI